MSKNKLNNEDTNLFRRTVGDVKRIVNDKMELKKDLPKPIPKQLEKDEQAALEDMLSDHYSPTELNMSDEISYQRPGIQNTIMRKLKRGQYSIAGELDLHGLTVAEARVAILQFLHSAQQNDKKCIRIIHGKGWRSSNKGPVLKPMVAKWLTQLDAVLAYCSARPVDGGTGALYVLLRSK